MRRGPKRHANSKPVAPLTPAALAAITQTEQHTLIEPADGMGAQLTRLPPGAPLHPVPAPGCEGQFLFVTAGSLQHGDVSLAPWEHLFLLASDTPPALTAGPGGAEIAALFIPHKEAAYA